MCISHCGKTPFQSLRSGSKLPNSELQAEKLQSLKSDQRTSQCEVHSLIVRSSPFHNVNNLFKQLLRKLQFQSRTLGNKRILWRMGFCNYTVGFIPKSEPKLELKSEFLIQASELRASD